MKRKLLSSMTALIALLASSCSSELVLDGYPGNETGSEEWVDVSFAISPESAQAVTRATRAGEDEAQKPKGPGFKQTVGRGSKIDMLVYAVYEKDSVENEETHLKEVSYTLLTQYGQGIIKANPNTNIPDGFPETAGNGQTIVYDPFGINDSGTDKNETNSNSYKITLRLMRGKEYSIAFWAQSSQTDAYNTSNLEKVTVSYAGAVNNDELRDAFCKVENFTLGADGSSREVILTRPFAQINVATTGADYYNIATNVNPNRWVAYSEIKLGGVAQSMNVVTDQIDGSTDNLTDVTFKRNIIPAYMYYKGEDDKDGNVKDVGTFLKERRETTKKDENFKSTIIDNEEFLYVKLNPKAAGETGITFEDYTEKYPTIGEDGKYLTETFKYLSMCYVLVPAGELTKKPDYDAPNANEDQDYKDPYTSSTLSSLEVKFAEQATGYEAFPPVKLTQVPVHRNWRTNILGGLYNKDVPTDEDPDDPNSVFKLPVIMVDKDVTFDGEYNNPDANDENWTQNPDQSDEGNTGDEEGEEENE